MSGNFELIRPLPGANFGGLACMIGSPGARHVVEAAEAEPETLPRALAESGGLLLLQGLDAAAALTAQVQEAGVVRCSRSLFCLELIKDDMP